MGSCILTVTALDVCLVRQLHDAAAQLGRVVGSRGHIHVELAMEEQLNVPDLRTNPCPFGLEQKERK